MPAASSTDAVKVEAALRRKLSGVTLVCQIDIEDDLLKAAERLTRAVIDSSIRRWRFRHDFPATFVTYVSIRGAERYNQGGRGVWPQLGVTENSSEVGELFLGALRQLGLSDFSEMVSHENARRFVSPMLIHGGIPYTSANALVRNVAEQLRFGLVSGVEGVDRLRRSSTTLDPPLGKPLERLLQWAPEFAADVVEAIIDFLTTDLQTSRMKDLPLHLQRALAANRALAQTGLKRLVLPSVEVDRWSGDGPEIVIPSGRQQWLLRLDGAPTTVRPGSRHPLGPGSVADVAADARTFRLATDSPLLWFDDRDRLVDTDRPLGPVMCLVAAPGWDVEAHGAPLRDVEEPLPLAGAWARHSIRVVDLSGATSVHSVPPSGSKHLPVRHVMRSASVQLIGDPVIELRGPCDEDVYGSVPQIELPTGDRPVLVRTVTSSGVERESQLPLLKTKHAVRPLDELIPSGFSGRLEISTSLSGRRTFHLAHVDGCHVTGLDRVLGTQERATASVRTADGALDLEIGPLIDAIPCTIPGSRLNCTLEVPRLRWSIGPATARLDLAPRVLKTTVAKLAEPGTFLFVRCGRPTQLTLDLRIDGKKAQSSRKVRLRSSVGREHRAVFSLDVFRDTLRRYPDAAAELVIVADGKAHPAVRCAGPPKVQPRSVPPRAEEAIGGTSATPAAADAAESSIGTGPAMAAEPERSSSHYSVAPVGELSGPAPWHLSGDFQAILDSAGTLEPTGRDAIERLLALRALPPGSWAAAIGRALGPASRRGKAPVDAVEWAAEAVLGVRSIRHHLFRRLAAPQSAELWSAALTFRLRAADQKFRDALLESGIGRHATPGVPDSWTLAATVRACSRFPADDELDAVPAAIAIALASCTMGDDDAAEHVRIASELVPDAVLGFLAVLFQFVADGAAIDVVPSSSAEPVPPPASHAIPTDRVAIQFSEANALAPTSSHEVTVTSPLTPIDPPVQAPNAPLAQIIQFCHVLGRRAASPGSGTDDDWPANGTKRLDALAERLWSASSSRVERYAPQSTQAGAEAWSRDVGEELIGRTGLPPGSVDRWLLRHEGTSPATRWSGAPIVAACLPVATDGPSSSPRYAAALMRALLECCAGTPEVAKSLADAYFMTPQVMVGAIPYLLELARRGHVFEPMSGAGTAPSVPAPAASRVQAAPLVQSEPAEPRTFLPLEFDVEVQPGGRRLSILLSGHRGPVNVRFVSPDVPQPIAICTAYARDELVDVDVPPDVPAGPVLVSVAGGTLVPARPLATGTRVEVGPPPRLTVQRPRGAGLEEMTDLLVNTARAEVVALAESARFNPAAMRGFFDSFGDGTPARSLAKLAQTELSRETLDRAGMVALFSMEARDRIELRQHEKEELARRSSLLFAALCGTVGPAWEPVGWPPNRSLDQGTDRYKAVIDFARRIAPQQKLVSWRYDVDLSAVPRLQATIAQLDADLGGSFVDHILVQPSWCLAPTLRSEGARFLLLRHRSAPESTVAAVLVGHVLGQLVLADRPRSGGDPS